MTRAPDPWAETAARAPAARSAPHGPVVIVRSSAGRRRRGATSDQGATGSPVADHEDRRGRPLLGVDQRTASRWVKEGTFPIPVLHLNGMVRVCRARFECHLSGDSWDPERVVMPQTGPSWSKTPTSTYSLPEAAVILGISPHTARTWVRNTQFPVPILDLSPLSSAAGRSGPDRRRP